VTPLLRVPLHLGSILRSRTAWVGFTASTGAAAQYHAILNWSFVVHPETVGGTGTAYGLQTPQRQVTCRNLTTGQTVSIPLASTSEPWDCEAAGLAVNRGERIREVVTISGQAN
jgi:Legume lectin domain